jgi:hypothetical protein
MNPFTVYTIPGSPFARAVLATLEEKLAGSALPPARRWPRKRGLDPGPAGAR